MQVGVSLEPAGDMAETIFSNWLVANGLSIVAGGKIEVRPELCLEILADLRERTYDQALMINATIFGSNE